jgi:hypothetical protein
MGNKQLNEVFIGRATSLATKGVKKFSIFIILLTQTAHLPLKIGLK